MKYINFNSVTIKNFLSVGKDPVTIDFKQGLNVITGINKDKEDRRNGVGKSTIADAIHFAIFGETIRELSKEFIVNSINKKDTLVELTFSVDENSVVKNYKIVRKLKPTKCFLLVDDIDLTESTIPNTNKQIKKILNSSPEVFQNCVIMSLNTTLPFMAQKKVEKRKFIEGILNLEIFSEMLLSARSQYNDVQKNYDNINKDYDHANNIHTLLTEQKNNFINNIIEQKDKIVRRINTIKEDISANKNKIKPINKELYEKSKNKYQQIKDKLNDISIQLSDIKTKITRHETEIEFHNKKIAQIGTKDDVCPVCLHNITSNDRLHIDKEKSLIQEDVDNCVDDIDSLKLQINNINKIKIENKNAQEKINEYISNIKTTNNNNKLTKSYIQKLNDELTNNGKDLKELESKESSIELKDLQNKIDTKLKEVNELERDTNEIYKELEVLEIVKYILSEEGVKSFIVKKILDVLNNRLVYYLKLMDANCVCRFNEFFEEEIVNEKGEKCSYFNFSGAERKNIDLAILFTFMDMRRLQGDVAYNLVMFDELLDSSLDEKGVELVLNIIKDRVDTYKESIYIISHRKESVKAATGDVIMLEKRGGITKKVDLTN